MKRPRQTVWALRNEKPVTTMDLRNLMKVTEGDDKLVLCSLIKCRRTELLKDFTQTDSLKTYKEASILGNYLYLLTNNEVYNLYNELTLEDGKVINQPYRDNYYKKLIR